MKEIPVTLVKANQTMLVVLTSLSVLFQNVWLLLVPLIIVLISLLFGPKANIAMRLATFFVKRDFSSDKTEAAVLLRFNQCIATLLMVIAVVILLTTGHWIAWVFVCMVTIAAAVALAGFCVGCFLYYQFRRLSFKLKHN